MRTSSGVARSRIDVSIVLMHPDFPEPVVPAISRCGIRARSVQTGAPEMSFPSQTASGLAPAGRSSKMSPSVTRFGVRFGSSTPTACLPGIGARIRISVVASAYERSSLSWATFDTFVPGASWSSYRVTRGPEIWPITFAWTPKFPSVPTSSSATRSPVSPLSPFARRRRAQDRAVRQPVVLVGRLDREERLRLGLDQQRRLGPLRLADDVGEPLRAVDE